MPALFSLTFLLAHGDPYLEPLPLPVGTLWCRESDWHPGSGQAYHPQEGDLVFFSSVSPFYLCVYTLGRTSHPWHVGMIVRDSCGELCVLESGGPADSGVALVPVAHRLCCYLHKRPHRRIWIRRIRCPLTPDQSRCLSCFAQMQNGKRFASWFRMGMMGLPNRPLKPTCCDQGRWFCAELVSEAMRYCGLCPAEWLRPEKTSPRDLFTDKVDISCGWEPAETWSPNSAPPPSGPLFAPR